VYDAGTTTSSNLSEVVNIENPSDHEFSNKPRKVHLTWKNVNVSVPTKKNIFGKVKSEKKHILQGGK